MRWQSKSSFFTTTWSVQLSCGHETACDWAAARALEIIYRPILLGAVMKATGNSGPLPIRVRPVTRQVFSEGETYGSRRSSVRISRFNTIRLLRAAVAAHTPWADFCRSFTRRRFAPIGNMGESQQGKRRCAGCWNEVGIDPALDRLAMNQASAANNGGRGGQPWRGPGRRRFLVGEEMFWGNESARFRGRSSQRERRDQAASLVPRSVR